MAAQNGDIVGLRKEAGWMEEKIAHHAVSATNYFPILKFYIHLKMLTGLLEKNPGLVHSCIEEGRQMRTKMGYRSSFFNLAYFYNHYAEALLALTDAGDTRALAEARALLTDADKYNPRYAWTRLNLARLSLKDGDGPSARSECLQVKSLLSGSDPDYIMSKALLEIQVRSAK
jgi:hypothetical protein